jgi:hypothetical protein
MIYSTADTKPTPASVQGVGVDLRLIWISLLHDVLKRAGNRTARFRCIFGGEDGYEVTKNWISSGWVRLEVQCVRIVSFWILFFTMHTPKTHAHLPPYFLHCPWEIWYTVHLTQKRRWRRFRVSASIFGIIWIPLLRNVWNVFVKGLLDSVLFSVVQTAFSTFDLYCAYGSAHTFSRLNYMKPSRILPYPRFSSATFVWV